MDGRNIDTSLTSVDIALRLNLGFFSEETPHPLKERDIGHKLKRIVTSKLSYRRKRPITHTMDEDLVINISTS